MAWSHDWSHEWQRSRVMSLTKHQRTALARSSLEGLSAGDAFGADGS